MRGVAQALILFSRRQLSDLTGIEDATLDYWARTSVLRAADGGGGKGQHRRFEHSEVMLAAILAELMKFGVAAGSLAQLATRFHDSLDWIRRRGVQDCVDIVASLIEYREEWATNGHVTLEDNSAVDKYVQPSPRKVVDESGEYQRILNWKQIVQYHKNRTGGETLSDNIIQLAAKTKIDEYLPHAQRFSALQPNPRSKKIVQEILLSRELEGQWFEYVLDPEGFRGPKNDTNEKAIRHLVSYLRIDLSALRRRLWDRECVT